MKTKNTLIPAALVAVTTLMLSSERAEARYGSSLNSQANRLEAIAYDLKNEVRRGHSYGSRQLMGDVNSVFHKVNRIDTLSRDPYRSLSLISSELKSLERLTERMRYSVERSPARGSKGPRKSSTTLRERLHALKNSARAMDATVKRMSYERVASHRKGSPERFSASKGRGSTTKTFNSPVMRVGITRNRH